MTVTEKKERFVKEREPYVMENPRDIKPHVYICALCPKGTYYVSAIDISVAENAKRADYEYRKYNDIGAGVVVEPVFEYTNTGDLELVNPKKYPLAVEMCKDTDFIISLLYSHGITSINSDLKGNDLINDINHCLQDKIYHSMENRK